jgi:hypothetical protein
MIGKTLKSKINGELFCIDKLFEQCGRQYYSVRHIASSKVSVWGKEWFEKGLMQNLEIVTDHPTEKDGAKMDGKGEAE